MKALSNKIILVVDDEPQIREVMRALFEMKGATVMEAGNGREAFQMLQASKFDIVYSDIRMAGGDGVELLEQISKILEYKPKIFLCSGYSDLTRDDALRIGASELFAKPFSVQEVLTTVCKVAGNQA